MKPTLTNREKEQRDGMVRLALVTERFRLRNVRMAKGLELGFRRLEQGSYDARQALAQVR